MAALRAALAAASVLAVAHSGRLLRRNCRKANATSEPFDCYTDKGEKYVGLKDTTETGRKCKNWLTEGTYSATLTGIGNHQYCRNPSGEKEKPWCFTVDPAVEWQFCDVKKCPENGADPEPWVAPEGSKSEGAGPCTYEPPEDPGFELYKEGRACMDHQGTTWWLVGMTNTTVSDPAGCKTQCSTLPGSKYFTFFKGSSNGNCGCYRTCVLVPENLTVSSPSVYKLD